MYFLTFENMMANTARKSARAQLKMLMIERVIDFEYFLLQKHINIFIINKTIQNQKHTRMHQEMEFFGNLEIII